MRDTITLERKEAEEIALQLEDLAEQTQIRSEEAELYRLAQLIRDKVAGRIP